MKREDVLKEAISLYGKIGDWEKYCELSIEAGEWEKAIMAAPHVSIKYWKELTNKYAIYSAEKNEKEKISSSLLSNQLQPALKNFTEAGDYEDGKIIWVTRGNLPNESNNYSGNQFSMNKQTIELIDSKLKYLNKNDELYKISYKISKDNMQKGFSVLSAASFLSIMDIFAAMKTLIRCNELEIAYMFMKITGEKSFEEDIILGLTIKELKKDNMYEFL
jgi:hypothetical protein